MVLLLTSPFVFRVGLTKASALSLSVLLLGLYFIFKEKNWPLVILAWLYVWLYGGFILILAAALAYAVGADYYNNVIASAPTNVGTTSQSPANKRPARVATQSVADGIIRGIIEASTLRSGL